VKKTLLTLTLAQCIKDGLENTPKPLPLTLCMLLQTFCGEVANHEPILRVREADEEGLKIVPCTVRTVDCKSNGGRQANHAPIVRHMYRIVIAERQHVPQLIKSYCADASFIALC